ncbi:MAG: LamG-like jellyroll fold domain-containing protein [Candidatus Hinthialibacter sp.]
MRSQTIRTKKSRTIAGDGGFIQSVYAVVVGIIGLLFLSMPVSAQGIFDSTNDEWPVLGETFVPGEAQVTGEGEDAVYSLSGNGNGLGETNDSDEGFYLFTERDESWSIQGRLMWNNPGPPETGSVGLMIRESGQDPSARHYTAVMRVVDGEERSDVRYRNILALSGLPTNQLLTDDDEPVVDPGDGLWFRLTHVKSLYLFLTEYSFDGENWILADQQVFPWSSGSLAYGMFIASNTDDETMAQAKIDRVAFNPSPPVIERNFSKPVFASHDTVTAYLDIHNSSQISQLKVEETIPAGWTAENISHNGELNHGMITWNLSDVPEGVTTLTYQALSPESPESRAYWSGAIVGGLTILGKSGLLLSGGDVPRVSDGILMLYNFTEGEGDTVHDTSGVGEAADLTIRDPDNVVWGAGSLEIAANTKIRSMGPVPKLFDTFTDLDHDGSITVEAWIAPANTEQTGPARIVTYSYNPSYRNFTLGQQAGIYQMRLRTGYDVNGSNRNGAEHHLETPGGSVSTTLTHVVYVRDAEWNTFFYLNGSLVSEEGTFTPDFFDNWDSSYEFGLGNEINEDRTWLGEFFLVCIYSRGLSSEEAAQNFAAGVEIPEVSVTNWPLF